MYEPSESQRLIRETARNYAQGSLSRIASELDREGRFPAAQLGELAELGLMGINVPEEYGGAAAGAVAHALAMKESAQGCASTAVTIGRNHIVAGADRRFGPEP